MSDIKDISSMPREPRSALAAGQPASGSIPIEDDMLADVALTDPGMRRSRPKRTSKVRQSGSKGFLSNLKIRRKLALIVGSFMIPLLILLGVFAFNQQRILAQRALELRGLEYLEPLEQVLSTIPLHRDLSIRLLNGNGALAEDRASAAAAVNAALANLVETQEQFGGLDTQSYIENLQSDWQALEGRILTISPDVSFEEHSALISENVLPLLDQVGDRSGLGRSANLSEYYLAQLSLETLPRLSESLSQLRDQGSSVLARGGLITAQERQTLNDLAQEIETDFAIVNRDINITTEDNPAYAQDLNDSLSEFESLANYTLALTDYILSPRFHNDISQALFFEKATRSVDAGFAFLNTNADTLDQELNEQISNLRLARLLTFAGVLLGLALAALLVLRIGRQITRPVDELATVAERVSQGDLSRFAQVGSRDELGMLAGSFNQAITGLRQAAERNQFERQQNEALQLNVGQFLDVAMDIADGDFTKRGMVTEDVLGNVVDAINLMVDEVGGLLLEVRNAADSVARGSGGMLNTTQAISDTTTQQSREAQKAREVTSSVTRSMREMAENAQASAKAADQALEVSAQGRQAVEGTLQGMQNIRREVQAISKRIKSLGDRSLEISEIVDTISSISSQTHLLALNASIEAAGAGAAGERFSVVAGEVRKLAEDSAQATQRVATLIQDIQSEVQEVVGSVEDGTQEVEAGYRVATEAGARLQEIAAIVQETTQFTRTISDITQAQVDQVENVNSSVSSIADLSQKSQAQVQQGRESAEQLKALAEQLRQNLSHFRLA